MSRVKPLDFGGWGRTLDIGQVYAGRLLARYGMAGAPREAVEETARLLVYGYPHHGYVIDLEEAAQLGLNIESIDSALYRASLNVVRCALDGEIEICDDGPHRPVAGYCGFAPAAQANDEPTAIENEEVEPDENGAAPNGPLHIEEPAP